MSIKNWPGGRISPTPPTPTGPYENSTASGVWTLDQVSYWEQQNQWPTAGNVNPSAFIENLFSTYLYTGNGATGQTIANGIDLSTQGGLVWLKPRSNVYNHFLLDTARGNNFALSSNNTGAQGSGYSPYFSFLTNGFSVTGNTDPNISGYTYASWTFRKQPKFFDVVTYTRDSSAYQTISHNLGSTPGCIIVKATSGTSNWAVYHRSIPTGYLTLNSTNANIDGLGFFQNVTSTSFDTSIGAAGVTYVAYLFAHDAGGFGLTGTDNVISCGSFTTDGSGNVPVVNLGYEPQWILWKRSDSTSNWLINDNMRGWTVNTNGSSSTGTAFLYPNLSNAEADGGTAIPITSTGFGGGTSSSSATFIYIAIRRGPMKTPTSGTSVFSPVVRVGTGTAGNVTTSLATVDSVWSTASQSSLGYGAMIFDRLRGSLLSVLPAYTSAESSYANTVTGFDVQTGYSVGTSSFISPNANGFTFINYNFRRAPGFFDEVCYTGTGSATTQAHNLGVAPELIITKVRSPDPGAPLNYWLVGSGFTSTTFTRNWLQLNDAGTSFLYTSAAGYSAQPNATTFTVSSGFSQSATTYVAYLFASCPGVSKVGSYTGTGALQTINCGFTGGARFVLIKRTDSTGDWFTYDSARGITSGNDPYLLMNSTAAEVTGTNYVDTTSVGFQVTAAAPAGLNASGGTYIFLAIA